ncbi:MAG: aminoacyl-tRNA hydrolase [Candidatus Aenigmarchaeota archaeon]|nr:aminoacyl-tRNA hydrolase [Candidatus Aenigmarchaeota archaeon]
MKQVIVVRKDLGMSVGKTAAQASHASLGAYKKSDAKIRSEWERIGCKKVVLKARSVEEIEDIELKCQKNGIPCFVVRDAGLTELSPGTVTAIGIGPEKD